MFLLAFRCHWCPRSAGQRGVTPPCVPYVLSVCWQGGHGPFWPLALAPLRWLTSFLHNWVRAQIISAYSAALPVSSSTYTKQKWTHTLFQIHIHVYQPWNNAVYAVFFFFFYVDNIWDRAYIYTAYLTWQLSYVQILHVFLINQLYQSCAMHHKSLIVLMQTISQDLSHLSPSVAILCVRRERNASSCLDSYESFIGFHHPRRENALNVFAIIPLITALCTWAKPTIRNCKLVSQ